MVGAGQEIHQRVEQNGPGPIYIICQKCFYPIRDLSPEKSLSGMIKVMLKPQRNNDLWSLHNAARDMGGAIRPPDPAQSNTVEGLQYQTTKIGQRVVDGCIHLEERYFTVNPTTRNSSH